MIDDLHQQRIALFGGSFDPPHAAHQRIPIFLLKHGYADQVWYVPVKHHPFGKVVSSDKARVEMLELLISQFNANYPELAGKLKIEHWELEQDQTSFTLKTLQNLARKYPNATFRWVIGTDNLPKFNQWQGYEQILKDFGVVVYPREGYPPSPLAPGMELLVEAPEVTVSSTEVRALAKDKQALKELVTPEVAEYISTHHLYTLDAVI